ncbi:MAG: ATP-binding protein [Treponema sp.]|nr:ATP-binding protein [Treponema sp.]
MINKIKYFPAFIFITIILTAGFSPLPPDSNHEQPAANMFNSFNDVPGVTDEGIASVKALRPWLVSAAVLVFIVFVLILILFYFNNKEKKKLKILIDQEAESGRLKNVSITSLEKILNSIDSMIYVTDPEKSEILFINESMKQHYGIEGDCTGKLCYKVLQKDLDKKCSFCPCFTLDTAPCNPVIWEEHSTLTNRIYRNTDRYINWPTGQLVHLQHSVDMTDLIMAKEYAEQSSRYKSAFLAAMSHEIRTPMNSILGIAEIKLQDKNLPPESEEAFSKIFESGDLLLNIINDILDLSKIEAGKLEMNPARYDIPSLINDTAQLNCLRYESKPIIFSLEVDEETPMELFGDELRIKQILNNILSNAFKYTDKGKVIFSVHCEYKINDNVDLVFRVTDTGHGMTQEQLKKLFDEYTRFNTEANRTTAGAGLGMNITKRLVDLMNGSIEVHSEMGKGSVFTVHIPQKRIGEEVCGKDIIENLSHFRFKRSTMSKKSQFMREYMPYGSVLIVDDVESNIYVAKGLLAPYGLKIDTASSGYKAVDKIKDGNIYDIIFMDHMMPGMDGIETVKILRSNGYNHKILALTANALAGQAQVFMQNGFDGFISKPIDSRELNLLLNENIRNKKTPEVVQAARDEQREKEKYLNTAEAQKIINSAELERFFILDAKNALDVIEKTIAKNADIDEAALDSFIIAVHGIKSALANIGELQASAFALRLEKAGKEKNIPVITSETQSFIYTLESLIDKYKPAEKEEITEITDADLNFLHEKLLIIKNDCLVFNKSGAKSALKELKQKKWPGLINSVLDDISIYLLHSSFKTASDSAENLISQYPLKQ